MVLRLKKVDMDMDMDMDMGHIMERSRIFTS
jgi:hypothetical protein